MEQAKTAQHTPKYGASATKSELASLQTGLDDNALTQALPVPDIVFGGLVLVLVVMFHAFWIRLIAHAFLKRTKSIRSHSMLWRSDVLFAGSVIALLTLHMAEVMLWSAALVFGGIVGDWSKAAYFAANCYTALGEPFSLSHEWRIVPPIIAISGIFTFAWTASVLVDFSSRYNDLRQAFQAQRQQKKNEHNPPH